MNEFFSKLAWVDVFVVLCFLWGCYTGWRSGLLPEILRIINYCVSIAVAAIFKESAAQYLTLNTFLNSQSAAAAAFLGLMVVAFIICKIISHFILKMMKVGSGNFIYNGLGLILGASRWLIIVSLFFMVVGMFPMFSLKADVEKKSQLGPSVSKIAPLLLDFLGSFSGDSQTSVTSKNVMKRQSWETTSAS